MRNRAGRAAMIVVAGIAAQTGHAQSGVPETRVRAETYLAEFADCVVAQKVRDAAVDRFLRTVPGSEGFYPASMKAADLHCLDTAARRAGSVLEMRMQPATFRDALYPALYRRDFAHKGPVAGIATAAPATLATEFDGDAAALPADYRPQRALGDCVARTSPAGAHALLTARPYARGEDEAVTVLRPALAACLAEGQTFRLDRATLRAVVGEAAYKLARAAPA